MFNDGYFGNTSGLKAIKRRHQHVAYRCLYLNADNYCQMQISPEIQIRDIYI